MNLQLHLKNVARQLSNHSTTLEKASIFLDKPWALLDEELEVQKLIFKKNKELILSRNGKVEIGKWDYFPEAKSLLIDRNYDKILCNEAFIDKGVMILKLDGTDNKFFMLANENLLPDLNAKQYLKNLRYQRLRIAEINLLDGAVLEVQRTTEQDFLAIIGNAVSIDSEEVLDGKYKLAEPHKYFIINNGKISKILTEKSYTTLDMEKILIQQQYNSTISQNDFVYIDGQNAPDMTLKLSKYKNLIVKDGKVFKLESKITIRRFWDNFLANFS